MVETDASDIGYGGLLTQFCPDNKHCQAAKFMFNKDCKHDVSKQMFARWQALLAPFDFEIQMRPSWPPPSRRGRGGRTSAGRGGHILAQHGNKQLIAANSSPSTSGINKDHPMYKEFMDFMKFKKELDNSPPIYSSALMEDENT
ncbi:hypothetical protein H5410_057516 [Solanum commersonii]|uniref:Reverse transcriptase/retrotransposon-derived protein RNase H-like domain-containing protein n=1 Tax=Solanum commersonii TaxID=4109 RepID=A0A9J5WR21_SOLCO|nr:hypothetical protein H5410_057516 [Solanum commersonii]